MTYLQQTIIQASALIGGFILLMLTVYLVLRFAIKKDKKRKAEYEAQGDFAKLSVVGKYHKLTLDIWDLMQHGLTNSDEEIQNLEVQRQNIIDYIRQLGNNRKGNLKWGNLKEIILCSILIGASALFIYLLYLIWDEVRFIYIFLFIIIFFGPLLHAILKERDVCFSIEDKDIDLLSGFQTECNEIYYKAIDNRDKYKMSAGDVDGLDKSEYNLSLWIIENIHNLHSEINMSKRIIKNMYVYKKSDLSGKSHSLMSIIVFTVIFAALLFILYQIWYYVCCGFLCFEFESLGDKIMAFIISMIGLGFVGGFIAICFGWNPPD